MFLYHFASQLGNFDYRSIRPIPSFLKPKRQVTVHPHSHSHPNAKGGGSGPGNSRELGRGEDEEGGSGVKMRHRHGRTGAKVELSEDYYANDGVVPIFRFVLFLNLSYSMVTLDGLIP